jgi:hypothetical protein
MVLVKSKPRKSPCKKSPPRRSWAKQSSMPNADTTYYLFPICCREYYITLLEIAVSYVIPYFLYPENPRIQINRSMWVDGWFKIINRFYNHIVGSSGIIPFETVLDWLKIRVRISDNPQGFEVLKNGYQIPYDMRAYAAAGVHTSVFEAFESYCKQELNPENKMLVLVDPDSTMVYGCVIIALESSVNYAEMKFIIRSAFMAPDFGNTMINTAEELVQAAHIGQFHIMPLYSQVEMIDGHEYVVPTQWIIKLHQHGFEGLSPDGQIININRMLEPHLVKYYSYTIPDFDLPYNPIGPEDWDAENPENWKPISFMTSSVV